MAQNRIVIINSKEYQEFIQDLPSLKGSNGKSLCLDCWTLMSTYQRDNIHNLHFPNHSIKKPREWTDEQNFINFAKTKGHITNDQLKLPLLSTGSFISASSIAVQVNISFKI